MKSSAGLKRAEIYYAVLQVGGKYPCDCDLTIFQSFYTSITSLSHYKIRSMDLPQNTP